MRLTLPERPAHAQHSEQAPPELARQSSARSWFRLDACYHDMFRPFSVSAAGDPTAAGGRENAMDLPRIVLQFFERTVPVDPGDVLLVAVSGGPDSTALLHVLHELRDRLPMTLHVAHVDHRLRGKESDADRDFVEDVARSLDLPCHVEGVDPAGERDASGGSLEEVARRLRYASLERTAARVGARLVLTGHSADDQVETLLHNLFRGSGPRGLGGMLPAGPGRLARPLLGVRKRDLLHYLTVNEIPFRDDSTNLDSALRRNWIRHHLLPELVRAYAGGLPEVLARTAGLFAEIDAWLTAEADRILDEAGFGPGSPELLLGDLDREHPALRRAVLRQAAGRVLGDSRAVTAAHVEAILDLLRRGSPSASLDLPGPHRVRRRYGVLVFESRTGRATAGDPRSGGEGETVVDLGGDGACRWGNLHLRWTVSEAAGVLPLPRPAATAGGPDPVSIRAGFDLDALRPPIVLRSPRAGERLAPLGMQGTRKISDVLIDGKVPREARTAVGVLCDNGGPGPSERVLWVVGQRQARHARIGPDTARIAWFSAE